MRTAAFWAINYEAAGKITKTSSLLELHSKLVPVIFSVSVFTWYQIQPVSVFLVGIFVL